jgi:hypothetical protein
MGIATVHTTANGHATAMRAPDYNTSIAITGLSAVILLNSGLYALLPAPSLIRQFLIVFIFLLCIFGVLLSLYRRSIIASLLSTSLLLYVFVLSGLYAVQFRQEFNLLSGGAFFEGGMTAFYLLFISSRNLESVAHALAKLALAYACAYVLTATMIDPRTLGGPEASRLVIAGDENIGRGLRYSLSRSIVVFGFFYYLHRFRFRPTTVMIVLIFLYAIYLSGSRGFSAVFISVLAIYLLSRSIRVTSIACSIAFAALALASMYVAFNPSLELLSAGAQDNSVAVRANSLDIAQALLPHFWLFGAGIPSGGGGYIAATGVATYYSSDLGLVGILFDSGVFGLVCYTFLGLGCVWSGARIDRATGSHRMATALGLTACTMALYSAQSPAFFGGPLTALMLAGLLIKPRSGDLEDLDAAGGLNEVRVAVLQAGNQHPYSSLRRT